VEEVKKMMANDGLPMKGMKIILFKGSRFQGSKVQGVKEMS